MTTPRPARLRQTVIAVAGLLLLSGAALGQNALGDGRALDRNLGVNSGGYNSRVRDLQAQIRYNNAIINGQVAGGRAFQGNTGYRATNEFGGATASDTLYTFQRDSAYSGIGETRIRSSDAIRYQMALSTGAAIPNQFAGTYGAVGRSPVSTARSLDTSTPSTQVGSSFLRSTSQFLTQRSIRPSIVGYQQDDTGGAYTLAASPLLGVSVYKIDQAEQKNNTSDTLPDIPGAQKKESKTQSPDIRAARSLKVSNPFTGVEATATGLPSTIDQLNANRGGAISSVVPTTYVRPQSVVHQRVLNQFQSAYDAQRAADPSQPGTSTDPNAPKTGAPKSGLTWDEQIVQMRATLRGQSPEEALKRYAAEQEELKKAPKAPETTDPTAPGTNIPGSGTTRDPAGMPLDPNASPQGTGLPTDATMGETSEQRAERVKRELEAMKSAGTKLGLSDSTLQALKSAGIRFERLDAGITPQPSGAGVDAAYQGHMEAAQNFLKEGRYFDAEDRFSRAVASAPGDPMAAIGRVHAQLGAGLYLSAAMNLRRLMTDNPELIGSKFAPALVPNAQRAATVKSRLRDDLARSDDKSQLGRDAGLLLAYIGHITDDQETTTEGLREFRKRIAADSSDPTATDPALAELLERLWLP